MPPKVYLLPSNYDGHLLERGTYISDQATQETNTPALVTANNHERRSSVIITDWVDNCYVEQHEDEVDCPRTL